MYVNKSIITGMIFTSFVDQTIVTQSATNVCKIKSDLNKSKI